MTELPEILDPPHAPRRPRRPPYRGRVFVLVVLLLLGVFIVGNWFTGRPKNLGAANGRLADCPDSPNCVCSQEPRPSHQIAALAYQGDGKAAFSRLADLLKSWPRTKIIAQTDTYMHIEFTTRLLRFVDDVEFLLAQEENLIHVRSASRVGHSDLGANRKRVEAIRAAWEE